MVVILDRELREEIRKEIDADAAAEAAANRQDEDRESTYNEEGEE